jgi:hypothetical protein
MVQAALQALMVCSWITAGKGCRAMSLAGDQARLEARSRE